MRRQGNWLFKACGAAFVALMIATPARAQAPAPLPPAQSSAAPAPASKPAISPEGAGCNTVEKPLSAGGASIVPEIAGQPKNWQPPGGEITFTVRSFLQMPPDALVLVCFRWKHLSAQQDRFITARPTHLDLSDGGRLLKVTVTVPPNLRGAPSRLSGDGDYAGLYLVPLAEVRILVLGKNADGTLLVAADVSHEIGVTNPFWAMLLALLTVLTAFAVLAFVGYRRLKGAGLKNAGFLLRIIATPTGYASLSQLQLVVWTFVVAGSAVYVMVLSGELIEITTGTLILLGISGAVTVASTLHDTTQSAKQQAAGALAPVAPRQPTWSDLVMNDVDGQREIDISRVQMLYFTLITATFVVMRVVSTYVIPEIPQGFQILMGISNAVYFGAKVAQPATTPAITPTPPDPAT